MAKKTKESKSGALAEAVAGIEKRFGQGKVMRLGDKPKEFKSTSSGSLKLDRILGGGFPTGRIIEVYGPEQSGKTGIALELIAQVQKAGGNVAIIDSEHALAPQTAEKIGVDLDNLLISQPDNGEEAFEIGRALMNTGELDLIVFDSVSAMQPKAVIEGEAGESKMGLHARLMSQEMPKLISVANHNDCSALFINQLREKIGVMFGSPETTQGGKALQFYASVRLDVRKGTAIKEGDKVVGYTRRVKTSKNKMSPPFQVCESAIYYEEGFDRVGELVDLAVEFGIINKSGSWYSYGDVKLGQGSNGVKQIMDDNPELYDEVFDKVKVELLEK